MNANAKAREEYAKRSALDLLNQRRRIAMKDAAASGTMDVRAENDVEAAPVWTAAAANCGPQVISIV